MSEADKIIKNLKNSGKKVEEFYVSNKTSDKNVGSIDEKAVNDDIELIKNLIENNKIEIKNVSVGQEFRLLRTLQNILAEREQKDKRIKELKEERQLVGIPVRNKRDGNIGIVLHQWENGSVAVLENINPRVINTHDSWNTLEIISDEVEQNQTKENSIPKQAVIDKINEYDKKMEEDAGHPHWVVTDRIVMNVLQELLEGRNENG